MFVRWGGNTVSTFQQVCKAALDAIVVMNRDGFQYELDIISSLEQRITVGLRPSGQEYQVSILVL